MSDDELFVHVYEEYLDQVFGFIAYRIGTRDVAEDLTQATFEKALGAWNRFDPDRSSPRTWLLSIANNVVIDHYRRAEHRVTRRFTELESDGDAFADPASVTPDLGVSADLAEALNELDERSRRLIAMRYGADLTGPEIAAATGLSLANVQQILSRATRNLRAMLSPANHEKASASE